MRTFHSKIFIFCVFVLTGISLAYSQQANDGVSSKGPANYDGTKTINAQTNDTAKVALKQETIDNAPKADVAPANTVISEQTTSERYDTIVKKTGGKMKVKITGKNVHEVTFFMPGEKKEKRLSTGYIKELRYADGRIDLIDNTPEKITAKDPILLIPESEWKKVEVAKSEIEVKDLVEKEVIEAEAEGKKYTTTDSFLEKNAIVILRKKAVNLNATKILVIDKIVTREYGEFPKMKVIAKAYANE
ncbi:MAG TPA: hypothetical protein PK252_04880 [Bacteroidales bacterium]|nr:hypothetical protein [Bacteroidales bacterium]